MPTDQPSSAPDRALPADARDDRTAATVLHDDQPDTRPGGGGLGGAAAGGQAGAVGGTAPGAPIDVPVPGGDLDDGMPPSADAQARREAVDTASEPRGSSR